MKKQNARVSAEATASYGAAAGVGNLTPFIVPLQRIHGMTGSGNIGTIELGEDRPLEAFSIMATGSNPIKYVITYNNQSNKAVDVLIRNPLPAGLTYVSGSASDGGNYDTTSRELVWNLSNIARDDYRIVEFSAYGNSSINNTAYATVGNKTVSADTGNSPQRGYFWLCDFDGGSKGTPQYDEWLRHGYPEYVYAGSVANGTGMKASLKDALGWRLENKPEMLVPVYSWTEGGGSKGEYHVVGFAEFVMTGFQLSGNPKTITGYFTDGTVAKGVQGSRPAGYFGIDTVWLVD